MATHRRVVQGDALGRSDRRRSRFRYAGFYGLPSRGLDSHFYTASQAECDAVEHGYDGAWLKERADAFYVVGANGTTGACPEGTSPVYRLWNARFDSNHRYTMSAAIKAEMVARGYVPEGSGPENVAFCARS
jgi:hypothetical protein